jgi:hypothetical protein
MDPTRPGSMGRCALILSHEPHGSVWTAARTPFFYTIVSVMLDVDGVDNGQKLPTRLEPTHCPNDNVAPAMAVMQVCLLHGNSIFWSWCST